MNVKLTRSMIGLEAAPAFLSDLIDTLTERGRFRSFGASSLRREPAVPIALAPARQCAGAGAI